MNSQARNWIQIHNEAKETERSKKYPYDHENRERLTLRRLEGTEPDWEDISNGGLTDASRVGLIYEAVVCFLGENQACPVNDEIHTSQLLPRHFLESKHFEIVQYAPNLKLVYSDLGLEEQILRS